MTSTDTDDDGREDTWCCSYTVRSFVRFSSFVRVGETEPRTEAHVVVSRLRPSSSAVQRSCWDDATVRACAHIFGDDVKGDDEGDEDDEKFEASDDDECIDEENGRRVRRASRARKRREGIEPE